MSGGVLVIYNFKLDCFGGSIFATHIYSVLLGDKNAPIIARLMEVGVFFDEFYYAMVWKEGKKFRLSYESKILLRLVSESREPLSLSLSAEV